MPDLSEVVAGDNTVTFGSLAIGIYSDCQLTVTPNNGLPATLDVSSFTIGTNMTIPYGLNDTGITTCGTAGDGSNTLICADVGANKTLPVTL